MGRRGWTSVTIGGEIYEHPIVWKKIAKKAAADKGFVDDASIQRELLDKVCSEYNIPRVDSVDEPGGEDASGPETSSVDVIKAGKILGNDMVIRSDERQFILEFNNITSYHGTLDSLLRKLLRQISLLRVKKGKDSVITSIKELGDLVRESQADIAQVAKELEVVKA